MGRWMKKGGGDVTNITYTEGIKGKQKKEKSMKGKESCVISCFYKCKFFYSQ
jgi:hypothetical protein